MNTKLSIRLIPLMVLFFVALFRGALAQNAFYLNHFYQASNYISLHFDASYIENQELKKFYQNRYYEPVWLTSDGGLNTNALAFIDYLQKHEYSKLILDSSFIELTKTYFRKIETNDDKLYVTSGSLDITLSKLFLEVAKLNLFGLVTPLDISQDNWHIPKRERNLLALLERTITIGDVKMQLNKLLPQNPEYKQLKIYLSRYQFIKEQGGWPQIPEEVTKLEQGDTSYVIRKLKDRLIITGDLDALYYSGLVYDEKVENSIKHFQYRHGLNQDGVVGKHTLFNLNIPVEERIQQILLNIEKLKWLPEENISKSIRVNIPSYTLKFFNDGKIIEQQRVVVGSIQNPTPIFRSHISNIVFNPYWNVPYSIAKEEIAPKVSENTSYLLEKNYEVLNGWKDSNVLDSTNHVDWNNPAVHSIYRFRQKPGPGNALGIVKFNLPNNWSIYLHDTPSKSTFLRDKRAYSHGCIRLHEPIELAFKVLDINNDLDKQNEIKDILTQRNTKTIFISDNISVDIVYFTTEIDEKGKLMLFEDIYGIDNELNKRLMSILM